MKKTVLVRSVISKVSNSFVSRGFTLLETLVSLFILSVSIVGPLAVISESSAYARQTKDIMIATYLAEESFELLQNQYDSLYLLCKKDPDNVLCTQVGEESSGQVAWRLFKERFFAKDGQPSCFINDNPDGCSFDSSSMIGDITITPVRYNSLADTCRSLVEAAYREPGHGNEDVVPMYSAYFCSKGGSIPQNAIMTATATRSFSRSVSFEHVPTYEVGPILSQYNDDIRLTSKVDFRGVNGLVRSVKITRFIHAKP